MTLVRSLAAASRRGASLEVPGSPIGGAALMAWLAGGDRTDSGIVVSATSSLASSSVWRGTSVISGLGGALPLKAYRRSDRSEVERRVVSDPHAEMTSVEFWRLTYVHRCLWGNHYSQKVWDRGGHVVELRPIDPSRVKVGRAKDGTKVFAVTDDTGSIVPMTSREIFHIPGLGYDGLTGVSPVRAARAAIALGLAAENFGERLFGSGSLMGGVLQTEQRLDEEAATALKARWMEKVAGLGKAHEIAILDSGAKFQPVTMPNKDAQFLESRSFQIEEVSRFWGVPLFLMNSTEKSTSWGTGLEQQASGFVTFDLNPTWLRPTEARITKELLLEKDIYAEYTVDGLMRGDAAARAAFYRVMREIGAYSSNDVRDLENMPPIDGGDTYLQPVNLAPLGWTPDAGQTGAGGTRDAATAPVVNVTVPQGRVVRTVERDERGEIARVVEEPAPDA